MSDNNEVENEAENGGEIEKHPLQHEWKLWYFHPDRSRAWHENLRPIASFASVEDFWAVYNHIEIASNLQMGSDYSVFKDGIQPMWEDARNKRGGRWIFVFNKKLFSTQELDKMWLEALLCVIGEGFGDESDQVCGVVINVRKYMDKISVWTADMNEAAVIKIGLFT